MNDALVGPVEGPACPGCGLVPVWDWSDSAYKIGLLDHFPGCPLVDTCGQFGPPWLPREDWHRDQDWLTGKFTTEAHREHLATAHARR